MFTDAELLAFVDEALPADRSSEIEAELRDDPDLRQRLVSVTDQELTGLHSVSAIWRRRRLTCPSREDLGLHLLGALDAEHSRYIDIHINTIGCRYCLANRDDLANASKSDEAQGRRRKFFQTSAGHLSKKSE